MKKIIFTLLISFSIYLSNAQPVTNVGTEFWTAYQINESFPANDQEMVLYLSAKQLAHVSITIRDVSVAGSPILWQNDTIVPANSAIISRFIPKTGIADCRMLSEGKYSKAINIKSDVPIAAYAHQYIDANSGATLLLPVNTFDQEYKVLTTKSNWGSTVHTCFFVIANEDSSKIEITPNTNTLNGWAANVSYTINLNKGQIYQVLAPNISPTSEDLSGSKIKCINNKNITVFCGSSRTGLACLGSTPSSGDIIFQQIFPKKMWGKKYLTTPSQNDSVPLTVKKIMTNFFKIMVDDTTTQVYINDTLIKTQLLNSQYYYRESNKPLKIEASKPVMVAQFMSSAGKCPGTTGLGDPEMIYISPITHGISEVAFYKNKKQAIEKNYVTIVIPDSGVNSLKIDGILWKNIPTAHKLLYPHFQNGYCVVTKYWDSSHVGQSTLSSDSTFTGIVYGLGSVESYGYNLGSELNKSTPIVSGNIFYDNNNDGLKNTGEINAAFVKVSLSNGNFTFTDINGHYEISTDSMGIFTINYLPSTSYHAVPASILVNINALDSLIIIKDIALQNASSNSTLSINIIPINTLQTSNKQLFEIVYKNTGNFTLQPTINFNYDINKLSFDSISNNVLSNHNGYLNGIVGTLQPGQIGILYAYFKIIDTTISTDTFFVNGSINEGNVGAATASFAVLNKIANQNYNRAMPVISKDEVANGKAIEFTIYFKNSNPNKISNLVIVDTLSNLLNINSFQLVSTSQVCKVVITGNIVKFIFNKTQLLSNANKSSNFGNINFNIQPKSTVDIGDVILNKSYVYFDYNLPIITNTTQTLVTGQTASPVKLIKFDVALLSANSAAIKWETSSEINANKFNVQRSETGSDFKTMGTVGAIGNSKKNETYSYVDNSIVTYGKFFYRLEILDNYGFKTFSETKFIEINGKEKQVFIAPNPVSNIAYIKCFQAKQILIYSIDGKVVITKKDCNTIDYNAINVSNLAKGVYIVKVLTTTDEFKTEKLIIK
jgi:uncharacterized repeat protein (TIGR01451 family)